MKQSSPTPVDTGVRLKTWTEEAERRRVGLLKAPEQRELYKYGIWSCAYVLGGPLKGLSQGEFLEVLRQVKGHETGWPPWWIPTRPDMAPYPKDGFIEAWLDHTHFNDPAHADYWLASPDGRMYLARGYQEDSMDNVAPGSALDLTIPIWRVAECLLHAQRLADALGDETTTVDVRFFWSGLKGRTLQPLADPMRLMMFSRASKQDTVTSTSSVLAAEIATRLPDLVRQITKPLYNSFDFFEPPDTLAAQEIAKMLGRMRQ